ncbi:MAG: hypothetical protein RL693_1565 [Verrucomicrobiota bacterium]|jgi:hypothetical protein
MLLNQAAQGMTFVRQAPAGCAVNKSAPHACCAWRGEKDGAHACTCLDSRGKPDRPEPASVPAPSGRDLISQTTAVPLAEDIFVTPLLTGSVEIKALLDPRSHLAKPHVRLPVLFCSILI